MKSLNGNLRRWAFLFYISFFSLRFSCLQLRGKLCCTFVSVTAKHVLLSKVLLGGWVGAKGFHGNNYQCNWLEQIRMSVIITVYV